MSLGSEQGAVQNPFVRYSMEVGWEYLSRDDALAMRVGFGHQLGRHVFGLGNADATAQS